jgi:hypothetical protein
MAKVRPTRTTTVRKRRIIITKPQEDKGDLQISSQGARIRLTPKLYLTLFLLAAASVAVFLLVSRYLESSRSSASSIPSAQVSVPADQSNAAAATPNSPPRMTIASVIPQTPDSGTPLDVKYEATDPDGNPISYSFRWFVNESEVQESSSSSLQPGSYHAGDVVYAEVTPADATSTGVSLKTGPVTIMKSPPAVSGIVLSPEKASVGDILTASPSGPAQGSESVSYSYQWLVNGDRSGRAGAQNTFDTNDLKKRDSISVAVTASKSALQSGAVMSNTVILQNRSPEILSSAPLALQGSSYTYQVVAKDPDGDPLRYRLERAPAGMTIGETSGLIQWSLAKDTMYAGRQEAQVRVSVDDGDGGTTSQDFSIVFWDLFAR